MRSRAAALVALSTLAARAQEATPPPVPAPSIAPSAAPTPPIVPAPAPPSSPATPPAPPAMGPPVAVFNVHLAPGIDPSLTSLVERQLVKSARELGYSITDPQTTARVLAGMSGGLTADRASALVRDSGSAFGLFASVTSLPGRYRVSVQVAPREGPARTAEASGVSSDLYASIDVALRSILPAPAPPAQPAPALAPSSEPWPDGRFRLAFGGAAAFGVSPGPFQNYLAGLRADRRFSDDASLGVGVYYANLKGKDGRAHNWLPWALFEYRVDLGAGWALPFRFASGYLPKNGPVVKTAVGVALPIGDNLEISTELFAPTVWITHERAVVSLDVAAEVGVTF